MSFITHLQTLERLDQLIRIHATGTREELANKLNISEKTVYNYLNELKDLGAEIEYNAHIPSYVYSEPFKLMVPVVPT